MAALHAAPPRTPSPKIRIHRSQSFDSPSSRISVTPIDDSPYSKSAGSIITKPLPRYNALKAAEQGVLRRNNVVLHTKLSEDSIMSADSDTSSASSSAESSPVSEPSQYGLFSSGSPSLHSLPDAPSPYPPPSSTHQHLTHSPFNATPSPLPSTHYSSHSPPTVLESSIQLLQYQDPSPSHLCPSTMFDPWLVRVVLDLYDVRGFDWTMIAEPIERIWGFKTSSAEVLGILSGNGRVGVRWWD